jgi:hypothetical protein
VRADIHGEDCIALDEEDRTEIGFDREGVDGFA